MKYSNADTRIVLVRFEAIFMGSCLGFHMLLVGFYGV